MTADRATAGLPLFLAADTRREAREAMRDRAPRLRAAVLEAVRQGGSQTADEIAERLGESVLAIRPRVSECHLAGLLYDTGHRRPNRSGKNAVVWGVR